MLGRQHAAADGLVRALDLRHVEQAGGIADQQRTRHVHLRQRLPAAGDDGACAGGQDAAAFKERLDQWVVLPLLEGFPRLVLRVLVVQAADIAERDLVVLQVVEEAAAVDVVAGGPSQGMHDLAGRDAAFRHLPQFLDPDRVRLRIAVLVQREALDQSLGQVAACAFGQHGDLRADVDALRVAGFVAAILGDAHVADAHADDLAVVVMQRLGGGEARVDLHAQRFGLRGEPGAHRAQRHDEITVVTHARRHHRELAAAILAEVPELVLRGRHADRRRIVAPAGEQSIQRCGLDHGAGQDVRADRAGLLDHADRNIGIQLFQPDGEGQARRAGADGDDVVLHHIAFDIGHRACSSRALGCRYFRGLHRTGQIREHRGRDHTLATLDGWRLGRAAGCIACFRAGMAGGRRGRCVVAPPPARPAMERAPDQDVRT